MRCRCNPDTWIGKLVALNQAAVANVAALNPCLREK
jgi:hypothetical protein